MTSPGITTWKQIGALLAGIVAVATIHGVVVVPSILDAASLRARTIAIEEATSVRRLIEAHLADVETIRANLVTKGEFDRLAAQLDRIEERIGRLEPR